MLKFQKEGNTVPCLSSSWSLLGFLGPPWGTLHFLLLIVYRNYLL